MKLTDAEREEFIALTEHTYDPECWLDQDLPLLREAKRQWEDEQEQAVASVLRPTDQPDRSGGLGGMSPN